MATVQISVIIPTLNEGANIESAVKAAKAAGASQIIVSDGGSDDATVRLAEKAGALVVLGTTGRGNQLQQGADLADADLLLFLHADCRFEANAWESLKADFLKHMTESPAKKPAKQPVHHVYWGAFEQRINDSRWRFRLLERGNALRIRWRGMPFGDQAMFVDRVSFQQVGGFPQVPLMEDVGLSQRLRRRRWPILRREVVIVDARRWQARGVIKQTLRNWVIQLAHLLGVSESTLSSWYR